MELSGSNLNSSNKRDRDARKAGLIAQLEGAHAAVSSSQRRLLEIIAECERAEAWLDDGARDLAQWVASRLGISNWAARRWITAARALPQLPRLAAALDSGVLGLDKVLELCRFATADSEQKLITWARRVMPATVRHKADVACAPSREDVVEVERVRYLRYWFADEGTSLCLEGLMPADQGAVVAQALDRMAGRLPDIVADAADDPEPSCEGSLEMRRSDALYALASNRIASDADADRATVVVHAELEALAGRGGGCETEAGAVLHPDTARRLACDCRLELVLNDTDGNALGIGQASRTPPAWLLRQLRVRDRGCTFPGCGARWFLNAHHIKHWTPERGPTDLGNLVLACSFHHRLVHEHRWDVRLEPNGGSVWLRPDGSPFQPGVPAPEELPARASPERLQLARC